MTTTFKKLYKLAESAASSNDEMYMPQPFGDDPEHKSTLDPANNPEPLGISQPKEDGNQFTGSKKVADFANSDTNPSPSNISAPEKVYTMDVEEPPKQQMFGDAGETSRGDNSIIMSKLTYDPELRKVVNAYVIENGMPQCSVCNEYYTPTSIGHAKLAHCGHCPEDVLKHDVDEGDVVDGDVVKTSSKKSSIIMQGSDSELYVRGYLDHLHGKPLDEDLAVLSDDYFNGYDQARFYGKTPLESVGAKPHHTVIPEHRDTALEGWEQSGIGGQDYEYDIPRNQIFASTLPTNVLEKFFNTEE